MSEHKPPKYIVVNPAAIGECEHEEFDDVTKAETRARSLASAQPGTYIDIYQHRVAIRTRPQQEEQPHE